LARKEHPAPAPQTKVVEKPVLKDGQLARAEAIVERAENLVAQLGETVLVSVLRDAAKEIAGAIASTRNTQASEQRVMAPTGAHRPAVAAGASPGRGALPAARASRPAPRVSDSNGDKGQQILDALAELEVLGAREPTRELVAFMAGYSNTTSKGFALPRERTWLRGWLGIRLTGK